MRGLTAKSGWEISSSVDWVKPPNRFFVYSRNTNIMKNSNEEILNKMEEEIQKIIEAYGSDVCFADLEAIGGFTIIPGMSGDVFMSLLNMQKCVRDLGENLSAK